MVASPLRTASNVCALSEGAWLITSKSVAVQPMGAAPASPVRTRRSLDGLTEAAPPLRPAASYCTPASRAFAARRTPEAPLRRRAPALLQALRTRSLARVALALSQEGGEDLLWGRPSPLCAALELGCGLDIVELLLRHGADVHALDAAGRSPLRILRSMQPESCADFAGIESLLLRHGARVVGPSAPSVEGGCGVDLSLLAPPLPFGGACHEADVGSILAQPLPRGGACCEAEAGPAASQKNMGGA